MKKRSYSLTYEGPGEIAGLRIADFGNLYKISGVFVSGQGKTVLLLSPTADEWDRPAVTIKPSLEEWCEILRRTNDPLTFERDATGTIKAIHRKQQFAISGAIRQMIWARDGFCCMYCGKRMGDVQLTVDHFIPLELEGKNNKTNYLSACRQCNKQKGAREPRGYCDEKGLDFEGLELYLAGKAPVGFVGHLQ